MALTPNDVNELVESVKKLGDMWMRIKLVFIRAFGTAPITREQEGAYLQIKSDLSRTYRAVVSRLPKGLHFDGDKMMEMLKSAITMEHLRDQSPQEKQIFYRTWHQIYIKLSRTAGALEVIQSGYYPQVHRARLAKQTAAKK